MCHYSSTILQAKVHRVLVIRPLYFSSDVFAISLNLKMIKSYNYKIWGAWSVKKTRLTLHSHTRLNTYTLKVIVVKGALSIALSMKGYIQAG